ncbi:hypothetical protein [uncultured Enterovirga sp.]|uniref:hypothetical protein n=1 Tax=uncultured Enterovirga sp. TaxID=2026352 RepID=UPI0035CC0102
MRTIAKAALVGLVFVAASGPASAYRSSRPKLELLTPSILRKVVACYQAVEQAEDRATGGRSEVYKDRFRLRDAALARCGSRRP